MSKLVPLPLLLLKQGRLGAQQHLVRQQAVALVLH
jgi:hypothetical protein